MLAIIDYGMGNINSLSQALKRMGQTFEVTSDPAKLVEAKALILPGVGAFGDAMYELEARSIARVIRHEVQMGKPILGICLGMQLLFTSSEEHGYYQGLNLLPGHVVKFQGELLIPHMGWNWLSFKHPHPLFRGLEEDYVYFVHSYHVEATNDEDVIATTDYGRSVAAIVVRDHIVGMQFHPEKSGEFGRKLLERCLGYFQEKAVR